MSEKQKAYVVPGAGVGSQLVTLALPMSQVVTLAVGINGQLHLWKEHAAADRKCGGDPSFSDECVAKYEALYLELVRVLAV